MKNRNSILMAILPVLACFALLPGARAITPDDPHGCGAGGCGGNTFVGDHALANFTTGGFNSAFGWYSLFTLTSASYNAAAGAGALALNNADSNTAIGAAALLLNTAGTENVAVGTDALVFNDSGGFNTAVGAFALFNSTAGDNTAIGDRALFNNTTGDQNTAVGGVGCCGAALFSNVSGRFNTAVGGGALSANTDGNDNTAVGAGALNTDAHGSENTAVGLNALVNATGSNNVALGSNAGNQAVGSDNVYIGYNMQGSAGESNACYIKSIFGQTNNLGVPVFIDANSKLGTLTSSKQFKEDIQQMDTASEALFALKPVTFHYKKEIDPAGKSQFGLVAEDVEKVNPDLVVLDKEGKPYSVRYDAVNAMLLNEFLKEHRELQELKKQVAALTAGLQRVSVQLEVSKSAPQTVFNNQ
jgi:hypothetical protein